MHFSVLAIPTGGQLECSPILAKGLSDSRDATSLYKTTEYQNGAVDDLDVFSI